MAKRRWWWSVLYGLHVVHMRFSSVLFSDVHRSNIELLPTTITRKFPTSALNEWNFSHIPQNRLNPRIVSYDCEINASIYRHSSFFVISCSQNYVQRISSSHTDYTRKAVLLLSFRNMACVTSNIQRLLSILHCSNKSINEYQIDRHWFHSAANVSDSCQNYLSKWWLRFFFTIRFQLHCLSANHARSPPPWCPSMQIVLDVCTYMRVHQLWFPFHAIFNIEFCIACRATNTHLYHIWWEKTQKNFDSFVIMKLALSVEYARKVQFIERKKSALHTRKKSISLFFFRSRSHLYQHVFCIRKRNLILTWFPSWCRASYILLLPSFLLAPLRNGGVAVVNRALQNSPSKRHDIVFIGFSFELLAMPLC